MDDDLFGDAYARASDPRPAHDAAERMKPVANRLESIVLGVLRAHGTWMSVLALEVQLKPHGIDKWSISPRMARLEEKGFVQRKTMVGLNSSHKPRDLTHWRVKSTKWPTENAGRAFADAWNNPTCPVCGNGGGHFGRATYVGAPDGGVPVHTKCLSNFYQTLDNRKYRY